MSSDGIVWAFAQRNVRPATKLLLVVMGDNAAPLDGDDGPLWCKHEPRWFCHQTNMAITDLEAELRWLQAEGYIEPRENVYGTWEHGRKRETFRRIVEQGWLLLSPERSRE